MFSIDDDEPEISVGGIRNCHSRNSLSRQELSRGHADVHQRAQSINHHPIASAPTRAPIAPNARPVTMYWPALPVPFSPDVGPAVTMGGCGVTTGVGRSTLGAVPRTSREGGGEVEPAPAACDKTAGVARTIAIVTSGTNRSVATELRNDRDRIIARAVEPRSAGYAALFTQPPSAMGCRSGVRQAELAAGNCPNVIDGLIHGISDEETGDVLEIGRASCRERVCVPV